MPWAKKFQSLWVTVLKNLLLQEQLMALSQKTWKLNLLFMTLQVGDIIHKSPYLAVCSQYDWRDVL